MADIQANATTPFVAANDVDPNVNLFNGVAIQPHDAFQIDASPAWPVPSTTNVIPAGLTKIVDTHQLQVLQGIRDGIQALRDEIFNSLSIQASGGSYIANKLGTIQTWVDALGATEVTTDGP
jgi:hypothetical protein